MNCDIVIPVWNQPVFTRDCIESIIKHTTDADYRLVIVDNASAEETRHYLESLRVIKTPEVIVIRNDENKGFVKAVNQGIAITRSGSAVCVMNNDTIATEGWLREMLGILSMQAGIGIVNPSSNNLGQKLEGGESIEECAERLRKESGKFVELGSAIGFCMLIKRDVITKVGVFDEVYGMGNFEDTDLSRRAIKEGFRCVRACGAYVYHRENSSFIKLKTFDEDFKRNREIFEFRWGRPKRIAYIVAPDDGNALKKVNAESIKLARDGNWIWYFAKEALDVPGHSNIRLVRLGGKWFYPLALWRVFTKKKKFDAVFVQDAKLYNILNNTAFLHKAKVDYY